MRHLLLFLAAAALIGCVDRVDPEQDCPADAPNCPSTGDQDSGGNNQGEDGDTGEDATPPPDVDLKPFRRIATLAALSTAPIIDHDRYIDLADASCISGSKNVSEGTAHDVDLTITLSECATDSATHSGTVIYQRDNDDQDGRLRSFFFSARGGTPSASFASTFSGATQALEANYTYVVEDSGIARADFNQTIRQPGRGAITESGTRIYAPSPSAATLDIDATYEVADQPESACPGNGSYAVVTDAPIYTQGLSMEGGILSITQTNGSLAGSAAFDSANLLVTVGSTTVRYSLDEIQQIAADSCGGA